MSSALIFWNCYAELPAHACKQKGLRWRTVFALLCVVAAFWCALKGQLNAGLTPHADGWNATVAMLLAYQGFHLLILLVLGCYLVMRSWHGHLVPRARATLDNVALLWHAAVFQVAVTEFALRSMPALMA